MSQRVGLDDAFDMGTVLLRSRDFRLFAASQWGMGEVNPRYLPLFGQPNIGR